MRHLKKWGFLSAVCFLCAAAESSAETLASQFEATAQKLTRSAAGIELSTATLAVFPFEADERLSRKRVNFAVSELLSHYILKQRSLQLIERAQLSEVLKEQRLGLSGAIDSKTAAGVGQLLGARLLILGNVVKLGDYYQITVKLVDARTAVLITSEINEVPIETFDKDAAPYLVLVPPTQAIGIFLTGSYGFASVRHSPAATINAVLITPSNPKADLVYTGFGARYWPTNKWMIEASYSVFSLSSGRAYELSGSNPNDGKSPPSIAFSGDAFRVLVNRGYNVSNKFKAHYGAGALYVHATIPDPTNKSRVFNPPMQSVALSARSFNYVTPAFRVGLEWKPQQRMGWGIFGNYNLLKTSAVQYAVLNDGGPVKMRVWKADLQPFSLETTLSIYF